MSILQQRIKAVVDHVRANPDLPREEVWHVVGHNIQEAFFSGFKAGLGATRFTDAIVEMAEEDPEFAKRLQEEAERKPQK